MKPPSVATALAEQAQLYDKALRLTEEFCSRLRRGDDTDADAFSRDRAAILERIWKFDPASVPGAGEFDGHEAYRRRSAAAIERLLALDRELLSVLEERKARVGRELAALGHGRRTLAAYRGPTLLSPAFLDRVS